MFRLLFLLAMVNVLAMLLAVAALLGIVLNLVLPGRSADAGAEKVPPVPRESYDDLARDFERAENGSNEKGQA